MSIQEYAWDSTGTNRVQIFQESTGGIWTVLLNNSIVGTIASQEEFMAGRSLALWDGSVLTVRLVNNQYQVMRNGQLLPPISVAGIPTAQTMVADEGKRPSSAAPYPTQSPYPAQRPSIPPSANMVQRNSRAQSAVISGIFSLILSFLTLATLVGFAGIITGTFAIVYGFMGLNLAKRLPNNAGRGQAITGIVLGSIGWIVVIISLIARSAQ